MVKRLKVAVVGSGFGGAVMACRLASEDRFEVHVLERGARYGRNGFPRRPDEMGDALWDPDDGRFGLFEWRSFPASRTDAVAASGLGGGSLIYSSVLYRVPDELFEGWPGGINRALLDRYYDRALGMLEGRSYPVDRPDWPYWENTPKARALVEATAIIRGQRAGAPAMRVEWPPLAVRFGKEPGREVINPHGVPQTNCVMCGECNLGCNTHSKNTLDLNYLAVAARKAAVRTFTAVRAITPNPRGGYDLTLADPRHRVAEEERPTEHFDMVIVSAGSMGSSELIMRMREGLSERDRQRMSPRVGKGVTPNGDLLGFVTGSPRDLSPTRGPTITGAIHFDSGSYADGFATSAWIEDGAFPLFLQWFYHGRVTGPAPGWGGIRGIWRYLRGALGGVDGESNLGDEMAPVLFPKGGAWTRGTMMMLGMGRDRAGGVYALRKAPRDSYDRVHLDWRPRDGELHYQRVRTMMERISKALGGRFVENPMDYLLNRYITVHPLGGLGLGDTPEEGAVDAKTAQLFGFENLYVVDASIIPLATGPNPSLTIAALAEMYAERLCEKHQ